MMGRTEKSQGLAPQATRKDARAKQARLIINKTIPAILVSNSRARKGVEGSLLIVDPGAKSSATAPSDITGDGNELTHSRRKGQGRRKIKHTTESFAEDNATGPDQSKQRNNHRDNTGSSTVPSSPLRATKKTIIRIVHTDSLSAAAALTVPLPRTTSKKQMNVCILNMASPLRPGGGVLNGATSQEEFLCARTTLLPSLKESFYRLPEVGGVFTHDVLVFRDARPLHDSNGEIPVAERFWIDVISAGMLRFPQLQGEDQEDKHWSNKDCMLAEAKMRAVLRIASHHKIKKLVLGAWGCGAYGNPVHDVAEAWRKILLGHEMDLKKEGDDVLASVEEVVFAISNRSMADEFATVFDKLVESRDDSNTKDDEDSEEKDTLSNELRDKIQHLQDQLLGTQNAGTKSRLGLILDGLKAQLKEQDGEITDEDDGTRDPKNEETDGRAR